MRRSILAATASAIGLAAMTSGAAHADDTGWYLRANAGVGLHHDADLVGGLDSTVHGDGLQSELDVAYSLGIGYELSDNWRLELDGDGLFTDMGSISGVPNTYGKLRTNSLMLNVLYDFANDSRFEPYIGAGLGIVEGTGDFGATDFIIGGAPGVNPVCAGNRFTDDDPFIDNLQSCIVSDKDTSFGWQAIAGVGIAISDNLTWDTHATYMDASQFDFLGQNVTVDELDQPFLNASDPVISPLRTQLQDAGLYSVMTGLRYRFGASTPPPPPPPPPAPPTYTCDDGTVVTDPALCPPPPPPPPPTFTCEGSGQVVTDLALCPPRVECPDGTVVYGSVEFCPRRSVEPVRELCAQNRQEIIYYEFDRGQSAETRNTINRILDIGDFCQVDNILVVGHTDTSGSAAYNLNLSKRRAKDAVDELVRQGIDRRIISSDGKGETEPFVQTGDGVKEQLNRRTEVLITLSEAGARDMSGM